MNWQTIIFGKLTWALLPQSAIAWGAVVFMAIVGIALLATITHFKFWNQLWHEWLTSLDPKRIGIMYLTVAAVMFVRGGIDALLMRTQQATSVGASQGIVAASHFQELFSAHGSIMIFFVAMGLMFGLINLIVPLQIGSRDVAFPFLNSVSFWLFVSGAILINFSLVIGDFSTAGWLSYPPLSELAYSPTVGVDYWLWSLQISGLGSLLGGINFLVTILKMRCKGMTLMKMPMFSWTVFGAMWLTAISFPILTVTLALLALDRTMGMHFFTAGGGGNMMMYVNLIWAWGHPEVYILVLPAFGVFSEVVPVFSGKKLAGYTSMVYSVVAIVFLSFLVWLHHFFTMGAGADVNAFFGIMTAVIAIPTGVKIFNWLFTMYKGRIRFTTPMLWFMGFVILFTLGGVAGVVMAEPVADYQLHNSLFLVAHFHTMIVSGVLFGYFAGFTYWFPKIFGFTLDERLGRRAFWLWLIGFILAFGPLYVLGLMGATRRIDHYSASLGYQMWFIIAGIGAAIIALGFITQLMQLYTSIKHRDEHRDTTGDPWNGRTLEWSIPSPAPLYNFAVQPVVETRDAFWESKMHDEKEVAIKQTSSAAEMLKAEDIIMPRNTPAAIYIGGFVFLLGFGIVWHLWWLAIIGLVGALVAFIHHSFIEDDEKEQIIPAAEVLKTEAALRARFSSAHAVGGLHTQLP
jgi:cytochrome o ubiquinol oxidase subunit 1